jgi:NADH dehydrogenase FAD-containing subunit
MKADNRSRQQVVVLGAGFGGLTFCQAFAQPVRSASGGTSTREHTLGEMRKITTTTNRV